MRVAVWRVLDLPGELELQSEHACRRALLHKLCHPDASEWGGALARRRDLVHLLLPWPDIPVRSPPHPDAGEALAGKEQLGVERRANPGVHGPVPVVHGDGKGDVVGEHGAVGAGEGQAGEGGVLDGGADVEDKGEGRNEDRSQEEEEEEAAVGSVGGAPRAVVAQAAAKTAAVAVAIAVAHRAACFLFVPDLILIDSAARQSDVCIYSRSRSDTRDENGSDSNESVATPSIFDHDGVPVFVSRSD